MASSSSYPTHQAGLLTSFTHLYEASITQARQVDPLYGEEFRRDENKHQTSAIRCSPFSLVNSSAREQLSDDSDGSPLQFMIPTRFAQVVDGIYRSSFPNVLHIDIHQALGVKTILSLVSTEYSWANVHWMLNRDTKVLSVPVIANKDPHIKTTERVVNMILSILMHEKNHPIVVHCNEGKHRTGCIIGCFRKLQGWDHASIIEEYREFAGDKARALDEDFIQAYEPRRGMKKQARRKQVATWIQAPERLTSNTPDERPLLPQHDNDTLFALSP